MSGLETKKKLGEERRRHEEQLHHFETGRLKKVKQKMESARGDRREVKAWIQ
jgi:hypothetical protein